jgi:hypothetical protein
MTPSLIWLTKLLLSHLLTDFILQPKSWVADRTVKHFASTKLYLHGFITSIATLLLVGYKYWLVALIILATHTLIDGWKSYQKQTATYFLVDQLLHLLVLFSCWFFTFITWDMVAMAWQKLNTNLSLWKTITAMVFVTMPAGILIGQLTKQWRDKLPEAENLANAGKWIGIIERIVILLFVLRGEYSAIGLLVAAKGFIRFSEKDRQEIKTEYLVIGTLLSIALALIAGLVVKL